eukprot:TRINITY_DN33030_c0_g1_i1.p1 TRINITY_DN33030_c0_g1~~TRINITY_DN33030_c0_g1_i1.p1  ORF type:complete len:577 (-),score=102.72 TRINITY_DN33030_c0_g1_i1:179-1909(-)
MVLHPLSSLDDDERRSLLKYYREQEAAGKVAISSTDFREGELLVVNYSDQYNESTAPDKWDWQMEAARGCVFFKASGSAPEVVVRAMPKFHGYRHCPEAELHIASDGPLTLMQKFDGSCISVTCFRGEVLIFTRGSRQNQQTQLARSLMAEETMAGLEHMEGSTFAFELIHHLDAKCEESRGPDRLVLLYACDPSGRVIPVIDLQPIAQSLHVGCVGCEAVTGSDVMRRIDALNGVTSLGDLREGFVVEIASKKYKVKAQTYQTLARSRVPRPKQTWLDKCFLSAKTFAAVYDEVEKMKDAPLDFGILAKNLLDRHVACIDAEVSRLRSFHGSFQNPKELNQSDVVSKGDKVLLFPCVKLPMQDRAAWFDTEETRFKVAQSLAKRTQEDDLECGFPVASGQLLLSGAPGKSNIGEWAKGLNCVVTLLRTDELQARGLNLDVELPRLGVEWLHQVISGASLQGPGDREIVKAAAIVVAERLRSGKTVAVHCSAGLHRTGIVGYLALRLLGHSLASTFELLGRIRYETRAELEKIHYKKRSSSPDAPASLVAVAEELLPELQASVLADTPCPTGYNQA